MRMNYTELGKFTLQSVDERHKARLNYAELGDVHWHPMVLGLRAWR